MPVVEKTARRLVLQSRSTTLIFDKDANKASMQRKLLFWKLKPAEVPLSEVSSVSTDKMVDRASGVEIYSTMIVTSAGAGWSFPANDKAEAEDNASTLRAFLGLEK